MKISHSKTLDQKMEKKKIISFGMILSVLKRLIKRTEN
jgi:hypothetical protein